MAGGYRSIFYNFTFRAEQKEAPAEPEVVKAWNGSEITGSEAGNKKSVKFNASDAENVDIWKLGEGKTLTVEYTAAKAEKVLFRVQATTKTSNAPKCGIYCQPKFDNNSGSNAPYDVKYQLSLNGANVANPVENVTETDANTTTVTTAKSLGMTVDSAASDNGALAQPVWFTWAEINLVQGKNTIVMTKPHGAGYSLYFVGFAIAK